MSDNRFGLGGSTMDEERPIISGHSDKEGFVKVFMGYLTSIHHPQMHWLTKGFSMILMDQDQ